MRAVRPIHLPGSESSLETGKGVTVMFRLSGVALVLIGCTAMGFLAASHCKMKVQVLESFLRILDNIIAELSGKITPLPELCRSAAEDSNCFRNVLLAFADSLDSQIEPVPRACMDNVLARTNCVNKEFKLCLVDLAQILGNYDLQGQLRQLDALYRKWMGKLDDSREGVSQKIRSYRVMGICAGCALAILLV